MEHRIRVCASSGAWGIHEIEFIFDLGTGYSDGRKSLDEIRKGIMFETLRRGYQAILHYKAIDNRQDAAVFLNLDNEAVADEYVRRLNRASGAEKEAAMYKANPESWKGGAEYLQGRIQFLERVVSEQHQFFYYTKHAFELLGIDVNDRDKTRRILNNLGFERTNI